MSEDLKHGHVTPRADSVKARCGGPAMCRVCQAERAALDSAAPLAPVRRAEEFQGRVQPWMMACFGAEIAADVQERNHRYLEEALELVQACGATASEAHQLVDYVYGRPVGDKYQEVGGVMVTLAALCLAQGMDMHEAGEAELARIWTKVEQIRAKQAAKPRHSPLPEHIAKAPTDADILALVPQFTTEYYANPETDFDYVGFARAILAAVQPSEDKRDAERYRWLREQHWNEADMAVVCDPKESVKLGFDCPSGQRLDEAIDAAIAKGDTL